MTRSSPGADGCSADSAATPGPTRCRFGQFAAALVEFSEADQSHQVALVRFQRGFQGRTLGSIVAGKAVRLGKVEPQGSGFWIRFCCSLEMPASRDGVAPPKRLDAQHVVRDRVLRTELQHGFEFRLQLPSPSLLLSLHGSPQMLLNAWPHAHR